MLEKIPWRKKRKPFSAWQVELTTRCPLRCKMCIRSENNNWQFGDMPLEGFKKILPSLNQVETVILEGWGESLLHQDLTECIRLANQEGSHVGFVTSAKGLTKKRVAELIEAGLGFVGFSLAGITPEVHNAIRVNSDLLEIVEAIRLFNEEKARQKLTRPLMHIVFLMVKNNICEVPGLPSFARELGIEEVVLTNICHTINLWQEGQRVFMWESGKNEYEKVIAQAEARSKKMGINLKRPSLSAVDVAVCDENPLGNLYISVEGEVSSCVYLNPPLPSPFKRIFCSKEYRVERATFGNMFKDPFPVIWNDGDYEEFRTRFIKRRTAFRELCFSLWDSGQLRNSKEVSLPAPPEPCRTCHKIIGV